MDLKGKRVMVFDLETNDLALDDITTIHVLVVYDSKTKKYHRFDKEAVKDGVRLLQNAEVIVGHNIIDYDLPVIKKFYPEFSTDDMEILDTLIWARLVYSDIKDIDFNLHKQGKLPAVLIGRHSLESYGYRLGVLKGDFHEEADWSKWTQEMSDYCVQDVKVTVRLLRNLLKKGFSKESIQLEHEVAHIIKRQTDRGIFFDVKAAEDLYARLLQRQQEIEEELLEVFPPWYEPKGKPTVPKRDNKSRGITAGCEYQNIKLVTFNPRSRAHIAKNLQKRYGWKPRKDEMTPGGQPKIDETVLSRLKYPEAKLLQEYLMLQKRVGQLGEGDKAWLKLVTPEGRIHGRVTTNGAVTGRMTHSNPNVAQVPATGVPYGKECRELFKPSPGYVMVGCDASGLELRCLAHYMARWDKGEYAKILLEGDIHTANQRAAGLPSRDNAKTFIYGFLYGAGNGKIGEIIGKGAGAGAKLRQKFLKAIPALRKLQAAVQNAAEKRGYLKGLDGRLLKVRSQHAALNTLLQSAGALIMKQALVTLDKLLQEDGLTPGKEYEFVANVHDEFQLEVLPDYAERVGELAVKSIQLAGKYFNFRCPLDGEYHIGSSWAETH